MKKKTVWIVGIVVGLIVLLALPAGYVLGRILPWTRYSMMDGRGMMDWAYGIMHPFSWGMVLLGWLVPAGVLIMVVVGVVVLVNALMRPKNPETPLPPTTIGQSCSACGKPAQADWTICPHCATPLN